MRTLILAIAATAALALLPATALADPVEILDAATEEPCSEVLYDESLYPGYSEGGCELEISSIGNIQMAMQGSGGVPVFNGFTDCILGADMRIGANGSGVLHNIQITPGNANCGSGFRECRVDEVAPYTDATDRLWPIQIQHDGSGNRTAVLTPCFPETLSGVRYLFRGDLELDLEGSPGWAMWSDDPTWFVNQTVEYNGQQYPATGIGTRGLTADLDIVNGDDIVVNDL